MLAALVSDADDPVERRMMRSIDTDLCGTWWTMRSSNDGRMREAAERRVGGEPTAIGPLSVDVDDSEAIDEFDGEFGIGAVELLLPLPPPLLPL